MARTCVYVRRAHRVHFKELAHVIVETWQVQGLPGAGRLEAQGRARVAV